MPTPAAPDARAWFGARGWTPFPFQEAVWAAYAAGDSGLIHAPTGTGKTYAIWWAVLQAWRDAHPEPPAKPPPLQVVWLTPLRALAADTEESLLAPLEELAFGWTVERRTGDTSSAAKRRQLRKPPSALITTPESLALLLSQANAAQLFRHLQAVVVDEWHELLGNKRGVQAELGLARLRRWRPALRVWGLSATLGNLDTAQAALLGVDDAGRPRPGRLIRGLAPKEIVIDSLLPESIERFPWAGHMGTQMVPRVVAAIEESRTTLVFTNTRRQCEVWYQALLAARPDWAGVVALHHGSLDAERRRWVEDGLRDGRLRAVVATSSLDLGVDFPTVDRVLQVGSPKGVGRLLQRAGRSGHQPGAVSRVTCVPTHALELVEVAAVRAAMAAGHIEDREPVDKPLDVLVQHLVTIALGGGFEPDALADEIRHTYAYRDLTDAEWRWAVDFVHQGGPALTAYPEYRRVTANNGRFVVDDRQIARRHRMSIGTIVGDAPIQVKYLRGGRLGTINESFISRLQPGDRFVFAGKPLEFVRVRDMTAWVRRARSARGAIPAWTGTSLPISPPLADAVRAQLAAAGDGVLAGPEMRALQPILALQARLSRLPDMDELLVERLKTREGRHLFFYPFAGKLVHQGLAALVAYRLAQQQPISFTLTANDYGFELLAPDPAPLPPAATLFGSGTLLDDITASLNASEMARRQFREIAQIAGLVFKGFPGQARRARHLQASSNLFYDVFSNYDAENLLLAQAHREVLRRQLEASRLARTLSRLATGRMVVVDVLGPTPLAFPLLVSRLQARLSSETLADRVRKMQRRLVEWTDA